jgi:hypothetical protein
MHFTNQQLHRRGCLLCAEPIMEQIGAPCTHLHDARSHRQSAAMHGYKYPPFVRSPDDPCDLEYSGTAEGLIRNVQQTSFACGAYETPRSHTNPSSSDQLLEAGHSTSVWRLIVKALEGPRDERGSSAMRGGADGAAEGNGVLRSARREPALRTSQAAKCGYRRRMAQTEAPVRHPGTGAGVRSRLVT